MDETQLDIMDMLELLNIEARYPSYKDRLIASLNKEKCEVLIKQTDEFKIMDKEQALNLVRKYKILVAQHLPIKSVNLYGSFSKGTYNADSDIDVAVIVDKLETDYFKDTPLLWKLRRKISTLIEPVLLNDDISNPLYHDILQTGIKV